MIGPVVFNAEGTRAYLSIAINGDGPRVRTIDLTTGQVLGTTDGISGGDFTGALFNPTKTRALLIGTVNLNGNIVDNIAVINPDTSQILGTPQTLDFGRVIGPVVFNTKATRAYLSIAINGDGPRVRTIDLTTGQVLGTTDGISGGDFTGALFNPTKTRALLIGTVNLNGNIVDNIAVINPDTSQILGTPQTLDFGRVIGPVVFNAEGTRAYLSIAINGDGPRVRTIDLTTGQVLGTTDGISGGDFTGALFNPTKTRALLIGTVNLNGNIVDNIAVINPG